MANLNLVLFLLPYLLLTVILCYAFVLKKKLKNETLEKEKKAQELAKTILELNKTRKKLLTKQQALILSILPGVTHNINNQLNHTYSLLYQIKKTAPNIAHLSDKILNYFKSISSLTKHIQVCSRGETEVPKPFQVSSILLNLGFFKKTLLLNQKIEITTTNIDESIYINVAESKMHCLFKVIFEHCLHATIFSNHPGLSIEIEKHDTQAAIVFHYQTEEETSITESENFEEITKVLEKINGSFNEDFKEKEGAQIILLSQLCDAPQAQFEYEKI